MVSGKRFFSLVFMDLDTISHVVKIKEKRESREDRARIPVSLCVSLCNSRCVCVFFLEC